VLPANGSVSGSVCMSLSRTSLTQGYYGLVQNTDRMSDSARLIGPTLSFVLSGVDKMNVKYESFQSFPTPGLALCTALAVLRWVPFLSYRLVLGDLRLVDHGVVVGRAVDPAREQVQVTLAIKMAEVV
jgi:hypothetical protein